MNDLTEKSLEAALIDIAKTATNKNISISIIPTKILFPTGFPEELKAEAITIAKQAIIDFNLRKKS